MKTKLSLLLILTLLFSQSAISQCRFSFGPEIGINSSGISHSDRFDLGSSTNYSNKLEHTYKPLVSPLIGFWVKEDFCKHFSASLGLQYYWVGENYQSNNIMHFTEPFSWTETQSVQINQKFNKLVLPLLFTYKFNIGKIKSFAFLGYSQTYVVSGSLTVKKQHEANSLIISSEETKLNPFDNSNFSTTAKRWQPSFIFGFGMNFTKKISASINITANSQLHCYNINTGNIAQNLDYVPTSFNYQNEDLAVVLRYSLK